MTFIPPGWSAAKLAYFAGLISAQIRRGDLFAIVEGLNAGAASGPAHLATRPDIYFTAMVKSLKPFVSEDRWQGCIDTVERSFR